MSSVPVGSVWELLRGGETVCTALVMRTDEASLVHGFILDDMTSCPDVVLAFVDRMLMAGEDESRFEWRRLA